MRGRATCFLCFLPAIPAGTSLFRTADVAKHNAGETESDVLCKYALEGSLPKSFFKGLDPLGSRGGEVSGSRVTFPGLAALGEKTAGWIPSCNQILVWDRAGAVPAAIDIPGKLGPGRSKEERTGFPEGGVVYRCGTALRRVDHESKRVDRSNLPPLPAALERYDHPAGTGGDYPVPWEPVNNWLTRGPLSPQPLIDGKPDAEKNGECSRNSSDLLDHS